MVKLISGLIPTPSTAAVSDPSNFLPSIPLTYENTFV
jgi:hypothetical protein